jgi:pyruvate dehydrogenase E1 component alpha subunit
MGHSMSDPGNYRTRAEIEKYQERDPLKLFSASLLEEKVVSDKQIEEIDAKVREVVEDSLRFAEESPLPDPAELYTDIYANPIEPGRK